MKYPLEAHTIGVFRCDDPHCDAVHVVMSDRHNRAIAMGAIGVDEVPDFIEKLNRLAARSTHTPVICNIS